MPLNHLEKRAIASLASLFCLRMLGLFMILPIFSLHAQSYSGSTPFLIGLALGIYGLAQACGQLPFGALSDHYSRKHIIAISFVLFITGSIIAATANSITIIILGRAIQGFGAVGSVIIALLCDLTRESQRSKAMAFIGITIGCAFFIAMLLGPVLDNVIGLKGIFWLTALLGLFAIIATYRLVPTPTMITAKQPATPFFSNLYSLLKNPLLFSFDIGIFSLHFILTASFISLPLTLHQLANHHYQDWSIYLFAMGIAIIFTFIMIGWAEKSKQVTKLYLSSIIVLIFSIYSLWHFDKSLMTFAMSLMLFFTAFNILEANLPSMISRHAPPVLKGTAVGIFSTFQYLGIFAGGIGGGWLYQHINASSILIGCMVLASIWLVITTPIIIKYQ